MNYQKFTAVIEREGDGYISLCPELDIASQGDSVEQAKANLTEAIEMFLESADKPEVEDRYKLSEILSRNDVTNFADF